MQTPTEDHDSAQMTDPVCGMKVSTESEFSFEFDDTRYFFCCQGCAQKFSTDPAGYLSGEAQQTAAMAELVAGALYICPMDPEVEQDHPGSCPICGMALEVAGASVLNTRTEYTCPMHPEILQDEPGLCPKCGMALEPRTIEIEEKNEELIDMSRRFWISVVLALPVFLLAMMADLAPALLPDALTMKTVQWIEFVFATPVVMWCGWPFFAWPGVIAWSRCCFPESTRQT
jgi:Cu+-exporting ATPase